VSASPLFVRTWPLRSAASSPYEHVFIICASQVKSLPFQHGKSHFIWDGFDRCSEALPFARSVRFEQPSKGHLIDVLANFGHRSRPALVSAVDIDLTPFGNAVIAHHFYELLNNATRDSSMLVVSPQLFMVFHICCVLCQDG